MSDKFRQVQHGDVFSYVFYLSESDRRARTACVALSLVALLKREFSKVQPSSALHDQKISVISYIYSAWMPYFEPREGTKDGYFALEIGRCPRHQKGT